MAVEPTLIRRAQAGDGDAFAEIIKTYRQRIFGTVYRLTGRPQEVEDVGQDVFLRLHSSLKQLREVEVFETWLYRLTVNTVYDHLRKRKRAADIPMADLSEEQLMAADAHESRKRGAVETRQKDAHETLRAMLDAISEEDRTLLEQKEIQGLTLKELRTIYNAKENALKVRLFRARKRAREAYQEMEQQFAPAA